MKIRVPRMIELNIGTPHPWMILFASLALLGLYLLGGMIQRFTPWEALIATSPRLAPTFSLAGGYYERDVQLRITPPESGAQVIFTLDGSLPTRDTGQTYTRPIPLRATAQAVTTVRARAVLGDGGLGPVASASYFLGVPATLPMVSLIVTPDDLWGPAQGIYVNPEERGNEWERPVDVTYVDSDRRSGFHVAAGIRVHGGRSRSLEKKSLRLYFRRKYGPSRLVYPLFADGGMNSFKWLILYSGGQDGAAGVASDWTLMREQLGNRLALELGQYAARSRPVLLFINGESWGIYYVQERMDEHFLADHCDIDAVDLLEAPETVGDRDVQAGDSRSWDHLMRFVETHDLALPANYLYVQSQVDLENFIDYNVLQIYTANVDWLSRDVLQFRARVQGGRWHWLFGGTDDGFGLDTAPTRGGDDLNLIQQVLQGDGASEQEMRLLRKLLENPVFLDRYLARTADLLNTTLAPASVIAHIDALAADLEPDIAYEKNRWSSPVDWTADVQALRDFALRRPGFVRQHLVECFNLDQVVRITLNPPGDGIGAVAVDNLLMEDLPWRGAYFQGVPIQVMSAPAPGYRFVGWDPLHLPQTPSIALYPQGTQVITPHFALADARVPRPGDVVFGQYDMDGGWFELRVARVGGVDLRGWRVTDNDTKTATDEGSLFFSNLPAFAHVPQGTTVRVVVAQVGDGDVPPDDLRAWDWQIVLHVDNGNLDGSIDPGFNIGTGDNLVLLAPGPTGAFQDDLGIAFVAESDAVTPASFGVLVDGVRFSR